VIEISSTDAEECVGSGIVASSTIRNVASSGGKLIPASHALWPDGSGATRDTDQEV
jgi:hypothetical protein